MNERDESVADAINALSARAYSLVAPRVGPGPEASPEEIEMGLQQIAAMILSALIAGHAIARQSGEDLGWVVLDSMARYSAARGGS